MRYLGSFDPISKVDAIAIRELAKQETIELNCLENGVLDREFRLSLLRLSFSNENNIVISEDLNQGKMYPCRDEEKIQQGDFFLVEEEVRSVLIQEFSFAKEILSARLKPERVAHSFSVANVCKELAEIHYLDANKAYFMGLWHDVSKNDPSQKKQAKEYSCPDWAVHGYLGAKWLRDHFLIKDREILQAIELHSLGDQAETDYDRVLFIADKIEPLRGYDCQEEWQLAKKDLKKCLQLVLHKQQEFVERKKHG